MNNGLIYIIFFTFKKIFMFLSDFLISHALLSLSKVTIWPSFGSYEICESYGLLESLLILLMVFLFIFVILFHFWKYSSINRSLGSKPNFSWIQLRCATTLVFYLYVSELIIFFDVYSGVFIFPISTLVTCLFLHISRSPSLILSPLSISFSLYQIIYPSFFIY